MAFSLSSPAFSNGQTIPAKYTCDGENLSPPLQWSGAPNETRGFVLIVEDPDAPSGMFRHWAVFDLPNATALPEGIGGQGSGEMLNQGVNHYHFRLAALDTSRLVVSPGAKVADIWRAAEPHMLAQTELVGTYAR
jgi:hypothetical protein